MGNSAATNLIELNVSGTGAKGTVNMPEKTFHITSSKVYNFVYDGEHWVFVGDCNTDKYV